MSGPVRPVVNRDNAYFFEGTAAGELRIQTCNACGVLRHPPGPACPECGAFDRGHVVAAGTGTVFSYLVHHAPQVPGKVLPLTIALVDLDEGVRMVAEMTGPVEIGDRVRVGWNRIDDELTLPLWSRVDEETK
ncbi:MAG TPA: OB-fold domain-containing protein [Nocardioides sp.]|nr:OB-fold domain-containing protein [Nocardioides sp.]